jgi:hypothetical protein
MTLRWSDGGSPPREMAETARDLGHEWTTWPSEKVTVCESPTGFIA